MKKIPNHNVKIITNDEKKGCFEKINGKFS